MTETLVFIFILDHLTGNVLNRTETFHLLPKLTPAEDLKCNVKVSDPLLQIISKELDVLMVPEWLLNENSTEKFHADSDASFGARVIDLLMRNEVDNPLEIAGVTEKFSENAAVSDSGEVDTDEVTESPEVTQTTPDKSPVLVALFETLSNVTAQTCAGTLLAPNWVLTASSCVNLLGQATRSFTNSTEESVYTVVVNATDPLTDGTAHNVTRIIEYPLKEETQSHNSLEDIYVTDGLKSNATENPLSNAMDNVNFTVNHESKKMIEYLKIIQSQPQTSTVYSHVTQKYDKELSNKEISVINVQQNNETNNGSNINEVPSNVKEFAHHTEDINADPDIKRPSIALMRIEPPVPVEHVDISAHADGMKVFIYGWVMREDESGYETMHKLSLEAETLSPADCAAQYNIALHSAQDELCLASSDRQLALAGQMSWGGPVVAPSGAVVAVSRGHGSAPLPATPLAHYAHWIHDVITNQ